MSGEEYDSSIGDAICRLVGFIVAALCAWGGWALADRMDRTPDPYNPNDPYYYPSDPCKMPCRIVVTVTGTWGAGTHQDPLQSIGQ